jgi:hypothetical protein
MNPDLNDDLNTDKVSAHTKFEDDVNDWIEHYKVKKKYVLSGVLLDI